MVPLKMSYGVQNVKMDTTTLGPLKTSSTAQSLRIGHNSPETAKNKNGSAKCENWTQ
jgi:hypothetical protein